MSGSIALVAFTNMSSHSFKRDNFGLSTGTTVYDFTSAGVDLDALLLAFSQSPAQTMGLNDGETMSVDGTSLALFNLEDLFKAAFDIFCVWIDQTTNARFGVRIHVPVQVFDIGTKPYWYVMNDSAAPGTKPHWILSGGDPSQPYTWNQLPGLAINATSSSEHSSLSIQVNIDKQP